MAAKRLFIAIDISDEARHLAGAYIDELRNGFRDIRVGWERPEKLHLIVKFLGDVEAGRVSSILEIMTDVASRHRSFTADLSGTGVFPNERKPRVLWFGVTHDGGGLRRIAGDVDQRLATIGFEPEKRGFNPHLTIARIREPEKGQRLALRHLEAGFDAIKFEVNDAVLYESELTPKGSIYTVVKRFPLTIS